MKSMMQTVMQFLHQMLYRVYLAAVSVKFHIKYFFIFYGKPAEFRYAIGGESFWVRKNTSDIFCLHEVWSQRNYLDPLPGNTVVDLGANIGGYTVYAARRAKHIFAFEPLASNYGQLLKNTQSLKNVTTFPCAVAGSEGTRIITFNPTYPGQASIIEGMRGLQEVIRTITLPQVFDLCRLSSIDLLKMDIEGAEYEILSSTPAEVLRRIGAITMEFHSFPPSQQHFSLTRILQEAGFTVTCRLQRFYWLLGGGYLHAGRAGGSEDALTSVQMLSSFEKPLARHTTVSRILK